MGGGKEVERGEEEYGGSLLKEASGLLDESTLQLLDRPSKLHDDMWEKRLISTLLQKLLDQHDTLMDRQSNLSLSSPSIELQEKQQGEFSSARIIKALEFADAERAEYSRLQSRYKQMIQEQETLNAENSARIVKILKLAEAERDEYIRLQSEYKQLIQERCDKLGKLQDENKPGIEAKQSWVDSVLQHVDPLFIKMVVAPVLCLVVPVFIGCCIKSLSDWLFQFLPGAASRAYYAR